jgi:NAD(P)-dependent dehydrogenase (short-subunit alcohol dehydrogenase family)
MMNKVVIITGGSQGIGRSMALKFAGLGAKVMICSRTKEDLGVVVGEITSSGGVCESFVADVSDAAQVKDAFERIVRGHGRIDVLVTCAGVYGPIGPLETNDAKAWEKAISVNLIGTMNAVHSVIPVMKKQGHGKIITMCGGGIGGEVKPNFSAYVTSKAAVAGFTEAVAKELKGCNVQINAISPGAVNTRLLDEVLAAGEKAGKDFLEKSRKQKMDGGTPPEKATELAVFLASEESDFVTGKVLSAIWDDYRNFHRVKDKLEGSLYNLRRIDDSMFFGKRV